MIILISDLRWLGRHTLTNKVKEILGTWYCEHWSIWWDSSQVETNLTKKQPQGKLGIAQKQTNETIDEWITITKQSCEAFI